MPPAPASSFLNLTPGGLVAGFVLGLAGTFLFFYGKRTGNFWHLVTGIALATFPMFVGDPWLTWGIGLGLIVLAWVKR